MEITKGSRIGSYEVISPLGTGGMGEVFRARDLRLGREVALKILPVSVSQSADRLSRFEQEARSASALSHPNIITIFEIGQIDSTSFIAMELVEGKTLRELLEEDRLPLKKFLSIATQVSSGIAKAHEAGIIHRDLKPENIMITRDGVVKILDFGLAKLNSSEAVSNGASHLATVARTADGIIMGTVGYMSPEQASGKPVTFHSDQFSLGAILYEMATGRRAFQRSTAAETLTSIIREEPEPVRSINTQIPDPLLWILERCLAKDPSDRYASTWDLARDLQSLKDHSASATMPETVVSQPIRRKVSILTYSLTALLALALGFAAAKLLERPPANEPPAIRTITYSGFDYNPAISPDSKTVAFTSDRDGSRRIWLRNLESVTEAPLTSGRDDFARFSPDGSTLIFLRDERPGRSLYKVGVLGGEPRKIVTDANSGDWSPDGKSIAFSRAVLGKTRVETILYICQPDGSGVREITRLNSSYWNPRWSPDGKRIALSPFLAGNQPLLAVIIVSLDGKQQQQIVPSHSANRILGIAWLNSHQVVYPETENFAHSTTTPGRVVLHDLSSGKTKTLLHVLNVFGTVEVLRPGRLIFDSGNRRQNLRLMTLDENQGRDRWLTRGGSTDRQPTFSPDGKWVLFSSNRSGNLDLWRVSTETAAVSQLTDDKAEDWDPAYTRDGRHLIWSSNRGGNFEIWIANDDGSDARQLSHDGIDAENPGGTHDGKWVIYNSYNPKHNGLWRIRPDGTDASSLTHGVTDLPEVSPDGNYVSYRAAVLSKGQSLHAIRLTDGKDFFLYRQLTFESQGARALARCRSRWMPDGKSITFVNEDDQGSVGLLNIQFVPGQDTSGTVHPLIPFVPEEPVESFGIAPDGKSVVVSILELTSNLMIADGISGLDE